MNITRIYAHLNDTSMCNLIVYGVPTPAFCREWDSRAEHIEIYPPQMRVMPTNREFAKTMIEDYPL